MNEQTKQAPPTAPPVATPPVACVLGTLIGLILWCAVTHTLLALTGQTTGMLGRTWQALCYSTGANSLTAIPCFGPYFGWIWGLVSGVIAVKEAQQVGGVRASFATLTLPAGVLALLFWGFTYQQQKTAAMMKPMAVQQAVTQLNVHAATSGGKGPTHAIEAFANSPYSLIWMTMDRTTPGEGAPLGETNTQKFPELTAGEQQDVIDALVESMPADAVAHRIGDLVFVYHGIDFNSPSAKLWLVVQWPDSDTPPEDVVVGLADSSTPTIAIEDFDAELAAQNTLRASLGLPALPHPKEVINDQPATAGKATSSPG